MARRRVIGAAAAAAVAAGGLLTRMPAARAAQASSQTLADATSPLVVRLLGTAGGPPPVANRHGTSTAVVINGKVYVIDCGRGSLSQYVRAGLPIGSLAGIFLTHLHSDHTVDYFSYPLLLAPDASDFTGPIPVYGPGPAGEDSVLSDAPGPVPGTAAMTTLANQTFAASSTFFLNEHLGVDPVSMLDVQEFMPPASVGASLSNTAPAMAPFTVMENDDVKVTALLVPHGAAYPSYAYRFDTDYGSVAISGDTAVTPNIPVLASNADLLVHEVVDLAIFESLGYPAALITHLANVHTDVSHLGAIAAESGVKTLVTTHVSPGDRTILSDDAWRTLLSDSAQSGGFGGRMILGQDLMELPV